jgi:dihydroorotase
MPNTDPPVDSPALVKFVADRGRDETGARILPAGCVSKGRKGIEMAELGKMAQNGAVMFTDDGSPINNANLLRLALLYSRSLGVRIMEHPEEPSLTVKAHVNDGLCSTLSGLKGWPACAEEIDVARGISLSRDTGTPLHFTHVSTKLALDQIRKAKAEGLSVTCDVTFHHLFFTERNVLDSQFDSAFKVNPPLRSEADRDALWAALEDGTVDAIVTDHAPYHEDEKDVPFPDAPFGIASLECAIPSLLTARKERGETLPLDKLLRLLTSGPASLLPSSWKHLGRLEKGAIADLTVLDLKEERVVDTAAWQSKAFNCPWKGYKLQGWPVLTLIEGVPFAPEKLTSC